MGANRPRTGKCEPPHDPGTDLPHHRDESAAPEREDGHHAANRRIVRQAKDDVEAGIQDTERIGQPNDVPAPTPRSR